MTLDELEQLQYFKEGDRDSKGQVIDWKEYDFITMRVLDDIRHYLGAPIVPVRGAHPNKPEAVDAWARKTPLSVVAMTLTRFPGISYGVYTGNTFHVDTRRYGTRGHLPKRWMGVKREEVQLFKARGLYELFEPDNPAADWRYLAWNHPRSLEALDIVCSIAEGRLIRS